jgi:hypothetical protein
MNNAYLDSSGLLPNYLNTSSSDSKYFLKDNTSVEFNQFSILKNNYLIYFENNIPMKDEKKN